MRTLKNKVPPTPAVTGVEGVESGSWTATSPHIGAGEEVRTLDPELGKDVAARPAFFPCGCSKNKIDAGLCDLFSPGSPPPAQLNRCSPPAELDESSPDNWKCHRCGEVNRRGELCACPDAIGAQAVDAGERTWRMSELLKDRNATSAALDVAAHSCARAASAWLGLADTFNEKGGNLGVIVTAEAVLKSTVEDFRRTEAAHAAALRALENHATGGGE